MRTNLTLEQMRRRCCLSRLELAKKAGVHATTVWRVERARHIPFAATRRRLAEALGRLDPGRIAWPEERLPPAAKDL